MTAPPAVLTAEEPAVAVADGTDGQGPEGTQLGAWLVRVGSVAAAVGALAGVDR